MCILITEFHGTISSVKLPLIQSFMIFRPQGSDIPTPPEAGRE